MVVDDGRDDDDHDNCRGDDYNDINSEPDVNRDHVEDRDDFNRVPITAIR